MTAQRWISAAMDDELFELDEEERSDFARSLIERLPLEAMACAIRERIAGVGGITGDWVGAIAGLAAAGVVHALTEGDPEVVQLAELYQAASKALDDAGVPYGEDRDGVHVFFELGSRISWLAQQHPTRLELQRVEAEREQAQRAVEAWRQAAHEHVEGLNGLKAQLAKANELGGKLAAAGADHQSQIDSISQQLASAGVPDHGDRAGKVVTLSLADRVRWLADRMQDTARARDQVLRELSIERSNLRQVGEARDLYRTERNAAMDERDELSTDRNYWKATAEEALGAHDSARRELEAIRRQAAGAAEDLDRERRAHQDAMGDAAATELRLQTALDVARKEAADWGDTLTGATRDRQRETAELRELVRVREAERDTADEEREELSSRVNGLDHDLTELRRRFDDLQRDRDRLARDLNQSQGDLDTAERKLRDVERDLARTRHPGSW